MSSKLTTLSPIQQRLIRASFGKIARLSIEIYQAFCDRLRETDPQLQQKLMSHMNQQNFPLLETLALIVTSLNSPQTVSTHLTSIKHRFIGLDLTTAEYAHISNVFLWSLEYCLQAEFTPNVQFAWRAFLNMIMDMVVMTANSNEIDAGTGTI